MLEHGGRLRQAAARYGIPLARWLDLSTGINPNGWPAPPPPAAIWQRLPEDDDGLEAAAHAYYGHPAPLSVAGSQAAIQALPRLRPAGHVAVLDPGYAEHAEAWRRAGHEVRPIAAERLREALPPVAVLVLIHPGNPTGARFTRDELLAWHARLAADGGWLIVDEAFIDTTPEHSLADLGPRPGLILLRSLGKFFGLAGARVGFVLAEPWLTEALRERLGPWPIAAPARWIARQALADRAWQRATRERLPVESQRLAALLARHGLPPSGGCALFQWVATPRAASLHEALARQGVLTRLFTEPASLRLGLPGDEPAWTRLETALLQASSA
ncbi:L-threonine-O-3-phosphate decarboxylase [Thioflavicoccus mobilis 8321]|uniref:threonine-phosphate decarboxylase n=1 Tax=Thioflavicoccus mobilis 8321 TaxID=765912 RepID=L0GZ98_9GAMM|nr:threonine-phosphate decarboxylase CobD [Thioflavicoccus mobilis]AGA92073.1 L-threonine-O-3-phosphate decarboxylase [Thioflavicoccus mobilis 8321]